MTTSELYQIQQRAFPGAQDHGGGLVSFAVYAPGHRSVHLAGSFNGWNWREDALHDRDGGFFVGTRQLEGGSYQYQFVLDEQIWICDPYATAVEWDSEPSRQPKAVVQVDRPVYHWQYQGWQRPNFEDLILQEIHLGDFSPEGTIAGLISRLDYLQEMGINAIELMPVYDTTAEDYWGYKPCYFLAVRRKYGTWHDMCTLVDQCHRRGIAVILDLVLAHTGQEHPFTRIASYEQSPWYGQGMGEQNQFGLPMLDYLKDATNAFAHDVEEFWLREYHVDGFRWDYLPAIGTDHKDKGIPFLMRIAREINPAIFLIGEYLPENPKLVSQSGLSGSWHIRFTRGLATLLTEKPCQPYTWDDFEKVIRCLDYQDQEYVRPADMINYIESHDEPRLIHEVQAAGFSPEQVLAKMKLGATLLLTAPGEPMLYQGQEWGESTAKDLQRNPLHWDQAQAQPGKSLQEHYRLLCRLRHEHESLRRGQFHLAAVYADRKSAVYHRRFGETDQIVVAVNFSGQPVKINIPLTQPGWWYDLYQDKDFEMEQNLEQELPAYSSKIFIAR